MQFVPYLEQRMTRIPSLSILLATVALPATLFFASSAWATPVLTSDLASFAVLGAAGVTNVATSIIGGNLGSAPNPSVGAGYTFSAGSLQANTPLAQQAQLDLDTAIVSLSAFGVGTTIAGGNLDAFQIAQGGQIGPGVYPPGYRPMAALVPCKGRHRR